MIEQVDSLDDPRLEPYRHLKERELSRLGNRFIAEGEHVVRRLIASKFEAESILSSNRIAHELVELLKQHGKRVPVFAAPDRLINDVVGFRFHTGCLAVGVRQKVWTIDDLPWHKLEMLIVACPDLNNGANLGSIIRCAAGFGADAILVGERSIDPFHRLCVRVSMGNIFSVPTIRSDSFLDDVIRLRDEFGVDLVASVCEGGEPLETLQTRPRRALLLGSEAQGLDAAVVRQCTRKATIPMSLGTDSLNVMLAGAIFLYHLTRVSPPKSA